MRNAGLNAVDKNLRAEVYAVKAKNLADSFRRRHLESAAVFNKLVFICKPPYAGEGRLNSERD